MDDAFQAAMWASTAQQVLGHATQMAVSCHPDFRSLIVEVANRFTHQVPPTSHDELSRRHRQAIAVSSMVGTICNASRKALLNPHSATAIFQNTKQFCDENWPETDEQISGIYVKAIQFGQLIG